MILSLLTALLLAPFATLHAAESKGVETSPGLTILGRYGVSLRMKDAPEAESATWGCFLLVQNPYTDVQAEGSRVSLTYEPRMK